MFEGKVRAAGSEKVAVVIQDNAEALVLKWILFIVAQRADNCLLLQRLDQLLGFLAEAAVYLTGTKIRGKVVGIAFQTDSKRELRTTRGCNSLTMGEPPYLKNPVRSRAMLAIEWDSGTRTDWWVLGNGLNRLKVVGSAVVGLPQNLLWPLQLGEKKLLLLLGATCSVEAANTVFRKEEVEALVGHSLATELHRQLGEWTCSFRLDTPKGKSYGCEIVGEVRRRGPEGDIADGFPVEFRVPMGYYTEEDLELRAKTVLGLYARALAELATIKEVLGRYGFRGCLTGGTLVIFGSGTRALGLVHWEDLKVVLSMPQTGGSEVEESVIATGSLSIRWKTHFFNPTFVEFLGSLERWLGRENCVELSC